MNARNRRLSRDAHVSSSIAGMLAHRQKLWASWIRKAVTAVTLAREPNGLALYVIRINVQIDLGASEPASTRQFYTGEYPRLFVRLDANNGEGVNKPSRAVNFRMTDLQGFYRSNALTKNAAICARVTESFGQYIR